MLHEFYKSRFENNSTAVSSSCGPIVPMIASLALSALPSLLASTSRYPPRKRTLPPVLEGSVEIVEVHQPALGRYSNSCAVRVCSVARPLIIVTSATGTETRCRPGVK